LDFLVIISIKFVEPDCRGRKTRRSCHIRKVPWPFPRCHSYPHRLA